MKVAFVALVLVVVTGCGRAVPAAAPVHMTLVPRGPHGCLMLPLFTADGQGTEFWEICNRDDQYRVPPNRIRWTEEPAGAWAPQYP
jgi:hypothetical protein